jgi:hypothetical protein
MIKHESSGTMDRVIIDKPKPAPRNGDKKRNDDKYNTQKG